MDITKTSSNNCLLSDSALHKTGVISENAPVSLILRLHSGKLSSAEATKKLKNFPDEFSKHSKFIGINI